MPLNESARLTCDGREKIKHLLRSFYDGLLAEHIPNRILVTVGAEGSATLGERALAEER